MKSFQNFVDIVERTTPGFGKPSGYDPQGEPMYTRRPGPREKGRRARVQSSPKSVTAVKGEIEAAKGFSDVKSGGLDTKTTDPKYTSSVRDPRAAKLGGNVWDDPTPARGRPFKSLSKQFTQSSTSTTLRTRTGGGGRDWLASLRGPVPSGSDPWKGSDYVSGDESRQRMRGNPTEPFGDTGFDPHGSQKGSPQAKPQPKPAQPQTPPKKGPEPVKQSVVSQQAKEYRASQKTVDVAAKPVGTKFAEPIPKPKVLPGLSSEPAGPLKPVRKGESQTIRPQKGPGRTGILGAPKAGVLTGAPKIEPVRVRDITPSVTASNRIPATKSAPPTPTPAKPAAAPTGARRGGRVRLRNPGSVITPKALEAALTKNRQQTALAQQAQNTKAAIQSAKTLKNVARVGTGVAAYLDFKGASQEVKAQGGGERRQAAAGATQAAARVAGCAVGGALGSVAGPVGSAAGCAVGGQVAVGKTGQLFKRLTGKPGDPVTRQSVASNLGALYRQNVPQSIRSQVSPQAKQTLKGVLGKAAELANKGYKGYRKVKKALDFSQGDN